MLKVDCEFGLEDLLDGKLTLARCAGGEVLWRLSAGWLMHGNY